MKINRSLFDYLYCFFIIASLILVANLSAVILCLSCFDTEADSKFTQNTTCLSSDNSVVNADLSLDAFYCELAIKDLDKQLNV